MVEAGAPHIVDHLVGLAALGYLVGVQVVPEAVGGVHPDLGVEGEKEGGDEHAAGALAVAR